MSNNVYSIGADVVDPVTGRVTHTICGVAVTPREYDIVVRSIDIHDAEYMTKGLVRFNFDKPYEVKRRSNRDYHNEYGPAIKTWGTVAYYLAGVCVTKEEHDKLVHLIQKVRYDMATKKNTKTVVESISTPTEYVIFCDDEAMTNFEGLHKFTEEDMKSFVQDGGAYQVYALTPVEIEVIPAVVKIKRKQ